jgi:hypothetical protein
MSHDHSRLGHGIEIASEIGHICGPWSRVRRIGAQRM